MIREYAEIFCWKNLSSFCSAKATHIFSAKNIIILYIESAKTVNEMTLNELVKLTMLWTTGPRFYMDSWPGIILFTLFDSLFMEVFSGWVVSTPDIGSQGPRFEFSWRQNSVHDCMVLHCTETLSRTVLSSQYDLNNVNPCPADSGYVLPLQTV